MNPPGFNIVGIGEVLWDEFPEGRRMGGAPANFAYHCQALGASSHIVSAVGSDDEGQALRDELRRNGLDTTYLQTDDRHPTGSVSVRLGSDGSARYTIHEGVAWDFMVSVREHEQLAAQADAVCFGTLAQRSETSRAAIHSFLEKTRQQCLRIFDVNLRQSWYDAGLIENSLQLANVLKLNDEELTILTELLQLDRTPGHPMDIISERYDLDIIALTRADRGCIIYTGDGMIEQKGYPVSSVRDTVGAGDCFTATLTVGLLRSEPLKAIAEQANRRAAYVCTQPGAMPDMSPINSKTTFST